MAEFSIIERFCKNLGASHSETRLAVGDDAAVIAIPEGMELAISADTMVEGVHFFTDTDPALLAHKILAVNLSDMAAMGAEPKWATLALTLPELNEQWIKRFSDSLNNFARAYGVQIIGGDTTQGPLNLCINIMGLLPKGKSLTRAKAKVGDDLYVSNHLGDAALALNCLDQGLQFTGMDLKRLRKSLDTPIPQVDLGQNLLDVASACLDISDGLITDLGHIAKQSRVSFEIDIEQLPLSDQYHQYVSDGGNVDLALSGGDDYQLAFTASPNSHEQINVLSETLDTRLSRIGRVVDENDNAVSLFADGRPYTLKNKSGYEHFNG